MSAKLFLKLANDPVELERLSEVLREMGECEDWPPDLVFRVELALEELATNIISYAYEGGKHEFEVTLISEADALTIEIADDGKPFDPLSDAPEPDLDAPIEERAVGKLGIHLVKTLMDEVRYQRDGGKNRLTLVSRRTA